jgi:hypothetical protein
MMSQENLHQNKDAQVRGQAHGRLQARERTLCGSGGDKGKREQATAPSVRLTRHVCCADHMHGRNRVGARAVL